MPNGDDTCRHGNTHHPCDLCTERDFRQRLDNMADAMMNLSAAYGYAKGIFEQEGKSLYLKRLIDLKEGRW